MEPMRNRGDMEMKRVYENIQSTISQADKTNNEHPRQQSFHSHLHILNKQ